MPRGQSSSRASCKRKVDDSVSYDPWDEPCPAPAVDPWGEHSYDPWSGAAASGSNDHSTEACDDDYDPWLSDQQPKAKFCRASLDAGAQLLAASTTKSTFNEYEREGASVEQTKKRWELQCSRNCHLEGCQPRGVPLKSLLSLCQCYWKISHFERMQLLQLTAPESSTNGTHWMIGETRVCFANFCRLLRTSQPTVRKLLSGQVDLRAGQGSHFSGCPKDAVASAKCDLFFQQLHLSAAEPLPEDEHCGVNDDADPWEDDSKQDALDPTSALTAALPVKYIQHCKISDLYWQFQAEWSSLDELHRTFSGSSVGTIPSYDTFRKRFQSVWKQYIKMRKTSQHSQCQLCFDLQKLLHSSSLDWPTKLHAAKELRRHQGDQYQDRLLYYALRQGSQHCQDLLVVIIDDMDKSKFAWPRFGFRKDPKELDNVKKPSVTFTAAIAHGWGAYLYMASPQTTSGSDYFMEVLAQTIESLYQQANSPEGKRAGKRFPEHLVVVADNTVKSAKNQWFIKYMCALTHRGTFKSCCLFQLMVGHTHEDCDRLFAFIFAYLKRKSQWQTPAEILQYIQECNGSQVQDVPVGLSFYLILF